VTDTATWQGARIVAVTRETPTAKTFRFALERPSEHRAGQHYIVRLTAPDGYTASRSYSVASAPDGSNLIDLTVERLEDGEVSTFLHDLAEVGDEVDVRGPIGGWFVWDGTTPALLVGGGSGLAPLMAMLRLARRNDNVDLLRLVVSVRTPEDLYYANEVVGPQTSIVYTRAAPPGHTRAPARLAPADVPQPLVQGAVTYVCGSPAFADAATDVLRAAGVDPRTIRVERFGPSG
jgi:ferredoxin-NADP reductase